MLRFVKETAYIVLRLDVPIVGFGRRVTGDKRPTLLFGDTERLLAVARKRPFQVVDNLATNTHDISTKFGARSQ